MFLGHILNVSNASRGNHPATPTPKCSAPTSASSNSYLLINVKPDKEGIFGAWFLVFFLPKIYLQGIKRSNLDANSFKNEGQNSILP
ncbi:hypothetical protein SLEP1_g33339 [Rubroshorea leprosula]|uniref:Uncharacterized protein n=1 Tax=Rubroshorea leprosula TaxID=152421 RepID=A0AAV5KGA0_9ROSI|nr:hypothetical protein SLEP1_g33339 [Rubroshorea leprosula]